MKISSRQWWAGIGFGVAMLPALTAAAAGSDPVRPGVAMRIDADGSILLWKASIASQDQLRQFLQSDEGRASTLGSLDAALRARFLASLVFDAQGLVSYDHAELVARLDAADLYAVLALFGHEGAVGYLPGVRVQSPADQLAWREARELLATSADDGAARPTGR